MRSDFFNQSSALVFLDLAALAIQITASSISPILLYANPKFNAPSIEP